MREAIGSTWTFQLIIIFILIFACFLTLVISYSKAYTLKNEVLTMIEKYEGITRNTDEGIGSQEIINNYLTNNSYRTTGSCETEYYGATNLTGEYEKAQSGRKYYYCFKESKLKSGNGNAIVYDITLFYKFNLPVVGEITTFRVDGRTNSFIGSNYRLTK